MLVVLLSACSSGDESPKSTASAELKAKPLGRQVGNYKVGQPYQIAGVWYYPKVDYDYDATGIGSWYGPGFHGRKTANGETYDQFALTAAHPTLPMPSIVRVTNLENGRAIKVRINDRGPFKNGRIIDLSRRAAQLLDYERRGIAKVRVQILEEESQQHAVLAQNKTAGESAPEAAPVATVTAAPLDSGSGGNQVAAAPAGAGRATIDADAIPWPEDKVERGSARGGGIYIQAGSFLRRDNATRLSANLSGLAKARVMPAQVGGQRFFRVRLGPIDSVGKADRMLNALIAAGHTDAQIVVN